MTGEWKVWLPGAWPSYREFHKVRGHWAATNQLKRSWQDAAGLLIKAAKVPKLEACTLHYLHRRENARFDRSNLAFGAAKVIEDALQDVGVLENDGWNYVLDFDHNWELVPKGKGGVLLTIRAA